MPREQQLKQQLSRDRGLASRRGMDMDDIEEESLADGTQLGLNF